MAEGEMKDPSAFYIGWVGTAPKRIVRFLKKYLFLVLPVVIGLGIVLALSQKKFGTGNFEFGQLTEIKGVYFSDPVACIKVINGKDIWGNLSYETIPLVGYGKHGAAGIIADIENEKNIRLDQKAVSLKGTLLYNDGKTILQIDPNDHPLVSYSSSSIPAVLQPQKKDLGKVKVSGEIIDPKCFFGVMKPGEGKPHRDCAIRCILGGISPMLAVKNEKGEANYYLLVSANGEKINEIVQDYVAEPVQIDAELVQYDDWIVAYINGKKDIQRYSYLREKFGEGIRYCALK